MYDFVPSTQKWRKAIRKRPATKKQKVFLKELGWDDTNYTKRGAWFVIDAILSS